MADLSNITALSGLTITSDQTTGTNNPNATFAVSNVTTAQRDLLQNVTPYVVNGATVRIKEGTIIFNISVDKLQMFRNGVWESVTTNISTATGVGLSSSPFSIPSGTRAAVEVAANQVNGFIYNDTTNNQVRGYINTGWMTLFTVATTATGVGLTNGAPFSIPSGTRAAVEVAANQVNGFIYNDTTTTQIRGYINNNWSTIFSMGQQSQDQDPIGKNLTNKIPLIIPIGSNTDDSIEIENANIVNGFIYYNTTNNVIRVCNGTEWKTITFDS